MADRLPPDDDDELFEWTDAPARPPSEPSEPADTGESDGPDSGERELAGAGARERPGTGERDRLTPDRGGSPPTGEDDPLATGERRGLRWRRPRGRPSDTEEQRRVRGDTGEFERSGKRPPPGRRSRHRDLPARVRRRQAIGIGAVALILLIALIALISGGGGGDEEKPIALKRLVGQSIVVQLGEGAPDKDLVNRVRKGQVGGVIVESAKPQEVQRNVQTLQQAASDGDNPPLLVLIDQEGGRVKQLPGPPDRSPQQLGSAGDEGEAKDQGQKTGDYLKGVGVNVDLAPVLDVPQPSTDASIKSRTYSNDASVVSKIGVAFLEGLQDTGVAATAKHFPGLGRATKSTDEQPVAIAGLKEDLDAEIQPFRDAVDAGVKLVMVSTASYPTLGTKKQAAFSPSIVQGLLRDDLGFGGVVITDDLETPAVTSVTTPGLAAASALKAGDDLLLYATGVGTSQKAFNSLVSQIKGGDLDRSLLESAYGRIASLKSDLQ